MPAFTEKRMSHLRTRIGELAKLSASWRRCPLTLADLNLAFIDPADRPAFTHVGKAIPQLTYNTTVGFHRVDGVRQLHFGLTADGANSIFLPTYAKDRMSEDDSDEAIAAREKVVKFVQTMADVQFSWMQVHAIVHQLNEICRSPAQFRAMFPAAASLFGPDEEFKGLVDQMRTFKAPTDLPGTSREFRLAAKDAAGLVTRTAMMPTDKKPIPNKHVGMSFFYTPREMPWGGPSQLPLVLS